MFFTCTSSLDDNKLKIDIWNTFYTLQTERKENAANVRWSVSFLLAFCIVRLCTLVYPLKRLQYK